MNEANATLTSEKSTMATKYGKAHSLKDSAGFIYMTLTQNYYPTESGILMLEELRQEFFQNYPELTKDSNANLAFSNDKKFLAEICAKYNSKTDKLTETQQKIDSTTAAMKSGVANMVMNEEQAKVK